MSSAPPPAASPPLTSTGAAVSSPPPVASAAASPPPSSSPPPNPSPPPPSTPASAPPSSSPPPPSSSPPPPVLASPPPATPSQPPPSLPPPSASPPPPSLPSQSPPPPSESPPPPAVPSSPPPTNPPPSSPSPPPPSLPSPPPPSTPSPSPPSSSPPSPPSAPPPSPPSSSPPPPSDPSTPPAPSLPAPAPNSTTGGTTPAKPGAPSSLPSPSAINSTTPSSNKPTDASSSGGSGGGANDSGGSSGGGNSSGGGLAAGPAIAVALVASLVVLSIVGLVVWFVRKRRKPVVRYEAGFVMPSPHSSSVKSDSSYPRSPSAPLVHHKSGSVASDAGIASAKSWFSYEELYDITNGFSPQNILGEGGFGCVFKGCLPDGRLIAIKQLKAGSGQGEREFRAEVEIISRIHHRHLVSLVGYCISESHRLLVYDFVSNGTLESHLHAIGNPVMNWGTRVKVAAGAARGLAYLHEDCHPRIIHRDIKSSNILLDDNFEAQVSDFGLARLAMDAATHVTTRVMGTFGYLAPEYASSGKLTEKSDVFSFGVVLLELITGRKPVDSSRPLGDESLVEWARPLLTAALESQEFGELPDPRLGGNYDKAEMFRMIEAAAACTRHSASMRPRMGKVARVLDGLADIDLNNGVTPGQSAMFNQAQSADIRLFQRMAFGSQDFSSDYSQSNWSRQTDF